MYLTIIIVLQYYIISFLCMYVLKIPKNRTRHRIARPVQRTTSTTTTEDSLPLSSTESYLSKANRRRKFRPEYTTTPTPNYEEGIYF